MRTELRLHYSISVSTRADRQKSLGSVESLAALAICCVAHEQISLSRRIGPELLRSF